MNWFNRFHSSVFGLTSSLLWSLCCLNPANIAAEPTNGIITVVQDTFNVTGGEVSNAIPLNTTTLIGSPTGGRMANTVITIVGADATVATGSSSEVSMLVTVRGSINDATATVTVSANGAPGIPATIASGEFTATDVLLRLGPNTVAATATDPAGNAVTISMTVYVDLSAMQKVQSLTVTVIGSIDDPAATVTVNSIAAPIATGQFMASGVSLTNGYNSITATATDLAGSSVTRTMRVFVDTVHPPRPTVGTLGTPVPAVTTASSLTVNGTKTVGTSIWINGVQVVPINSETTWTSNVNLVEGDNELSIVAKDAAGHASATNFINIIVDNLPPVLTVHAPAKTNFNPFTLTGTVDDSLTTVKVNGVFAARNKRDFTIDVPLTLGANTLTVIATSPAPNNYVTTQTVNIILGTKPTILSIQPVSGTKLDPGVAATLQMSTTDAEGDPRECQMLLDDAVLVDWATCGTRSWTPQTTDRGVHTLEFRARDGFGGEAVSQANIYVLRRSISPP